MGLEPAKDIAASLAPLIEAEGYELVLAEYQPGPAILRLYIDRLGEGERINVDDCANVSRWVSDVMDAEGLSELVPGTFSLEVSSPGLDRPLTKDSHFQGVWGRELKLEVIPGSIEAFPERRRFRVELVSSDEDAVVVRFEGHEVPLAYDRIESARLVPDFGGGGNKKK